MVLAVAGFPTADAPHRSVFELRGARSLAAVVDLHVLYLRAWKPGRARRWHDSIDGIPVTSVTVPQSPVGRHLRAILGADLTLYRYWGQRLAGDLIASADLIHSVDLVRAGIPVAHFSRAAGIHHVAQLLGSEVISVLPRVSDIRSIRGWEKHIHAVASAGHKLAEYFSRRFPEIPNVVAINRGVDLNLFRPDGDARGPQVNRPPIRFAYFGGFPRRGDTPGARNRKGGELLLEAWARAESSVGESASLLIGGPGSNDRRLARWRRRLRRPELVFQVGTIHPEEMPGYLRASDVVLMPSIEEGLPNVAMEAQACGTPVLASDAWGLPEAVSHGETGRVFTAGSVDALVREILATSQDRDDLPRLGRNGRKAAEEHFDGSKYGRRIMSLYERALAEPLDRMDRSRAGSKS